MYKKFIINNVSIIKSIQGTAMFYFYAGRSGSEETKEDMEEEEGARWEGG